MDPEIQEYAYKHPRRYACMLLGISVTCAFGSVRSQTLGWYELAVFVMMVGLSFLLTGSLFLAFGRRCFGWNDRLIAHLNFQDIRLKPLFFILVYTVVIVAASVFLLNLAAQIFGS